jgi:hypothetical protein
VCGGMCNTKLVQCHLQHLLVQRLALQQKKGHSTAQHTAGEVRECVVACATPNLSSAICSAFWCSALLYSRRKDTAQHSTAQHSTAQHSTAQHSTAQHSTAQHSTAQHSTAQHSTAHSEVSFMGGCVVVVACATPNLYSAICSALWCSALLCGP